jgi:hypothetical protein
MSAHSTAPPAAPNDDLVRLDSLRAAVVGRTVRAPFRLGLVVVLAARLAAAAQPCPDEPGLDGIACRIEGLGVRAGAASSRLAAARTACDAGHTADAIRELRGMGRALARAGNDADVLLTDALRRATIDRFRRHPCPELVDVLSPRRGERVPDGDAFVLLRLAAAADPATLSVRLDDDPPVALDPGAVSDTQASVRLRCSGGQRVLHVTIRSRDGTRDDLETVPISCGGDGVLGAEIESLIMADYVPERLRVVPVRPLRGGTTVALVATRALRTTGGRLHASAAFRAAAGLPPRNAHGPTAIVTDDPLDPRNPFPSQALVRPDGTVVIPDGFSARGLPALPRLDGVRAFLRRLDAGSEEHHGFSPNGFAVLGFDAAIRLDEATADRIFLLEIAPGTGLRALLDALERERKLDRRRVVAATVFPIEDLPAELAAIHEQIRSRPTPAIDFADPDPTDTRAFGIFHPGDSAFAAFFGGNPPSPVGAMVRASFPSPDYRENGRFLARFLDGSVEPPEVRIEFLLALPRGTPPFPTVVIQHGFGGDDTIVAQFAADFTAAGLALIGIPAPEHGPRGNFLDFFDFDDFNAFGNNFRQSSVDLFTLTRLLTSGLDIDGDGVPDLRQGRLGYLGQSLGGVIGGVFTAVEPGIAVSVLNVPGGKLSQLAGAVSPLAAPFLARFATEAGISLHVCGGDPTGAACNTAADCAPGIGCGDNPDFTALLDAAALDFQTQLDPGDGTTYAHLLRLDPAGAVPKPVLVQEGIGDMIVANPLTEALARAIALPANRADTASGGVAGLWRFPPPAGHGILDLPEVRAQAVRFLATGGTILSP